MIYLDNASTTNYKPKIVVDTVVECLTKYSFNPHRGGKSTALLQQKIYQARKKLSLLFNNGNENFVTFTSGCTQALNLAILGKAKRGHVILSATEHNSVLRPIMQLHKRGFVDLSIVKPDCNGQITVESLQKVLRKDSYLLCVSQASNVTGKAQRLFEIGQFARANNLLFLVDCAQSFGYYPTDMTKNNIDMVAIAPHKGLHAMQGVGALIFNERSIPRPITFGGTGTESHLYTQPTTIPDGLESGTQPCANILAMSAGVDWWLTNHKQNAQRVADSLDTIFQGLQQIPNVKIYSQPNKSGIVAFNVGNLDSEIACDYLLERYGICLRGGLHCAPAMHEYLGTSNQGIIRASVSCVTTQQECYTLLNGVQQLAKTSG